MERSSGFFGRDDDGGGGGAAGIKHDKHVLFLRSDHPGPRGDGWNGFSIAAAGRVGVMHGNGTGQHRGYVGAIGRESFSGLAKLEHRFIRALPGRAGGGDAAGNHRRMMGAPIFAW